MDTRAISAIRGQLWTSGTPPIASRSPEGFDPHSDDAENPPWLIRLAIASVCTAAAGLASTEKMTFKEALEVVIGTGPADVSPGFYSQMLEAAGV